MKKLFWLVLLFLVMAAPVVEAADPGPCTLTATLRQDAGNKIVLSYTCTANAAGAWATATLPSTIVGYYLLGMETLAGATAPSAWSITLPDVLLVDLLGGAGATRSVSTTVGQRAAPMLLTGIYGGAYVPSTVILTPTGNSTASAVGYINLIFIKN